MNCTTAANQEKLNVYVPRVIQIDTQWADAGLTFAGGDQGLDIGKYEQRKFKHYINGGAPPRVYGVRAAPSHVPNTSAHIVNIWFGKVVRVYMYKEYKEFT